VNGDANMSRTKQYILTELKTIEKECQEKGISASEWVKRYADEYRKRHWADNRMLVYAAKKNIKNQSRWVSWLEWVNHN